MGILSLASEADALVVDDRAFNRHLHVDLGSALRPLLTTLDLLRIMHARGIFGGSEVAEFRAKLRVSGLALIPVDAAELVSLLAVCPVNEGVISETAELRSIREAVLGLRMTDILQLPQEHPWLESLLRAWIHALKAQWIDGAEEEAAAARSDWLLKLVDLRAWSHRYPEAMRIGLVAAAAFPDKSEWSKVVGEWITELAFEDQDIESATKLLSHIRVLCHVEPELWRTCARAEAALRSIVA